MGLRTLAHLSDLHIGRSVESDRAAARLVESLAEIDHVVVTGDLTHRGRRRELERFNEIFSPLREQITVVPGNHDRLSDDIGAQLLESERVRVREAPGLFFVCVDSTGPHNRHLFAAHGEICERVLDEIDAALDAAPFGALRAILLHHHPIPLPTESFPEKISHRFGWPYAAELRLGPALLERAHGRCELILHGHRHVPREHSFGSLRIFNAGSSSELESYRIFSHYEGELVFEPTWLMEDARATHTEAG